MKCINFDRAFERYMAEWMKENSEKYKDDMDVIEDMMPDVYLEFLKKPANFLDGIAPQDYFEKFDNADMLVSWLCDYIAQGVPVPDLLLERVTALGDKEHAVITAGGVDVREVDPKTMASKLCEGLYFAGEVLDVDARTGGYNLQIAWATAQAAAKAAADKR